MTVWSEAQLGARFGSVTGEKSRPAGTERDPPPRFPTIIRTPTAVATEADADFRAFVERSGASVVRVSRGRSNCNWRATARRRSVVLHGNWQARVEVAGIYRGITVSGGPASAAAATTYTSREALERLIAGDSAAGAVAGDSGWQFVRLDCGAGERRRSARNERDRWRSADPRCHPVEG